MVAIKAKFDGQTIQVPDQLRGAKPGEVLIVYDEANLNAAPSSRPSIWDFLGKADHPRTASDIDQQIRTERESWEEP